MKININSILRIFSLTVVIFSIFFIYNTYKNFQNKINNIEKKLSLLDKSSVELGNQQPSITPSKLNEVSSPIFQNQGINSSSSKIHTNYNIETNSILQSEYQKYKENNNLQYTNPEELLESSEDDDDSNNTEDDNMNNDKLNYKDLDEEDLDEEDLDEEDQDEEDLDEEDLNEDNEGDLDNNIERIKFNEENMKTSSLEESIEKDQNVEVKSNNKVLENGDDLDLSQLEIDEIDNFEISNLDNLENISELLNKKDKFQNILRLEKEEDVDNNEKLDNLEDNLNENNETKITNDEKINYYKNLNLKELKEEYKRMYNKDSKPKIKKNELINELINKNN